MPLLLAGIFSVLASIGLCSHLRRPPISLRLSTTTLRPPTMKFTFALASLAVLASTAFATDVRYDETYDNANEPLADVACSDGTNGLITKGFSTLGSLPSFPNVAAVQAIAGWNSPSCGTCWEVTYNGRSVLVTGVDHAGDGINMSLEAMNTLTNNQGVALGTVSATVTQVAASQCGL